LQRGLLESFSAIVRARKKIVANFFD